MKYREQLLHLILHEDDNALIEWIQDQPLLDQPEILRELKSLTEEIAKENGDAIQEMAEGFERFEEDINNYEDKILDEKLAEANLVMALEAQEKTSGEMSGSVEGVREYVIGCITSNAPNANAMRELAKHIIQFEIDAGTYQPENWAAIL